MRKNLLKICAVLVLILTLIITPVFAIGGGHGGGGHSGGGHSSSHGSSHSSSSSSSRSSTSGYRSGSFSNSKSSAGTNKGFTNSSVVNGSGGRVINGTGITDSQVQEDDEYNYMHKRNNVEMVASGIGFILCLTLYIKYERDNR